MKFLNKLKDRISRIFRGNNNDLEFLLEEELVKQLPEPKISMPIELPKGEIVSFMDEILDTNSEIAKQKFNHNLDILINKTKENGKIDRFMLIREDNWLFFISCGYIYIKWIYL